MVIKPFRLCFDLRVVADSRVNWLTIGKYRQSGGAGAWRWLAALACVAVGAIGGARDVRADDSGLGPRNQLSIGINRFIVNDRSDSMSGLYTPPGATADVFDTTSLAVTYRRYLGDRLSVQLAIGAPPKFDVHGDGTVAGLGTIVSLTALNPTVFLNYHFGERDWRVRPFAGVGVNYTRFVDEEASASLTWALGGPTSVSLESYVALAVIAGVDVQLPGDWVGTVSATYLSAETTATLNTFGIERKMDFEVDPVTLTFALGYAF